MTSRISLNVHLFKGEVTCTKEVGRLFQLELAGEKGFENREIIKEQQGKMT